MMIAVTVMIILVPIVEPYSYALVSVVVVEVVLFEGVHLQIEQHEAKGTVQGCIRSTVIYC